MAAHDHDHGSSLSEIELRVRALESILVEKGYVEPAALDQIVEAYETRIGPHIGACVIAKAWSDSAFRRSLLEDATEAVSALVHERGVFEHGADVDGEFPQGPWLERRRRIPAGPSEFRRHPGLECRLRLPARDRHHRPADRRALTLRNRLNIYFRR